MTFTRKIGWLWNIIPKLDSFEEEFKRANGDQVKEAEAAWRTGLLNSHQLNRLRMIWRFCKIADQAKEIEAEWQKIQQTEHDAFFAFQVFKGRTEADHAYKKGITDGIKWCIERFSQ